MRFRFFLFVAFLTFTKWKLFAQKIEFSDPVKLGSHINSEAEEILPLLSPDGSKLYFTRAFHRENVGGAYAGMDIWVADKLADGQWGDPTNKLKKWNDKDNNSVIGIRKEGDVIYFLNADSAQKGISFSKRVNNNWSNPEFVSIPGLSRGSFLGFYMNSSYDVLLISMRGRNSYGNEDIYVSLKNDEGNWEEPINVGPTINTDGFEISPFLSENKKYLFFSSNGHGGYGDADIFFSQRLYGSWDVWTKPVNLGRKINSKKFDAYFSMYGDSVGYYSSNIGNELSDIYKVDINLIEDSGTHANIARDRELLSDEEIQAVFGFDFKRVILFDRNSFELNDIAKETLWFIHNKIGGLTEVNLAIIGHTDIDGGETDNLKLSNARAGAVADYLRKLGMEGWRITTESYGKKLASFTIENQKSLDRKVEIFFYRLK